MNTILARARASAFAMRNLVAAPPPAQRMAAAVCLPAALASILVGLLPAPCTAAARPGVQARLERVANGSPVTLQLVDGSSFSGAFHGFLGDWRDSVDSSIRYESWRRAHPEGLPRLGESMSVVLGTSDTLRRTFQGVGPAFLALGDGNTGILSMVAFTGITGARSDSGGQVASWTDLRGRLLEAPPLTGIGVKFGEKVLIIPRESIFSVNETGSSEVGSHAVVILLAVVATLVLVGICINQAVDSAANSAASVGNNALSCWSPGSLSRGYDRRFGASNVSRGLDPWPAGEKRRP